MSAATDWRQQKDVHECVPKKSALPRIDNDSAGTVEIPYVARNNGQVVNKRRRPYGR